MAAEIVTFAASGFAGPNRTLTNLERCTKITTHFQLVSNDVRGRELSFYSQLMRTRNPRLILFGGWCKLYDAMIAKLRKSEICFGVWWLSTGGQTDMSAEVDRFYDVLSHAGIRYFAFAHEPFAQAFSCQGNRVAHLPIPMDPLEFQPRPKRRPGPTILSLFCSPHEYRRKNILNTLLAVSRIEDDCLLYINGLSEVACYRRLLGTLKIRYRDMGWMPEAAYQRVLNTIDIGLQLSFTESFNQVAAEHLARSIPVLASPLVPAMTAVTGEDRPRLIVDSFEDPGAIADRLRWLIRHPAERHRIAARASERLRLLIQRNTNTARRVLKGWTAAA